METSTDIINDSAEDLLDAIQGVVGSGPLASVIMIVLILLATAIVARLLTRFLRKLLSRDSSPLPSSSIFVNIGRVVIWCIGVSIILSTCFGVNVTAAVAALGVGGIALSLGFQDTISNLIGGLQVSILGIVEPGDHIEIGSARGVVADVNWRHVTIDVVTGGQVVVPNSVINKGSFTKLPPAEKVITKVNFTKEITDLSALAARMELAVSKALEGVTTIEKPPAILFDSITEFGYAGSVIVWVDSHEDAPKVKDAVVRALAPFTAKLDGSAEQA